MEYKNHFLNLLNYDFWANSNVMEELSLNNISGGKAIQLFSHILNSEIIWLKRIKNEKDFPDPMLIRSFDECGKLLTEINKSWIEFVSISDEDIFNLKITYINNKGVEWRSEISEILIHMINHSTYHRAQIASFFRIENIKPPYTDYIGFSRLKEI